MKNDYEIRGDVTVIFLKYKETVMEALISTSRLEQLNSFKGTLHPKWDRIMKKFYVCGYTYVNKKKKCFTLHRLLVNAIPGEEVDHINHNTLDNTDSNLRKVNGAQNSQNRMGPNKNSSSGFRGVYWHKRIKKWQSSYMLNGKHHHLGYFDDKKEAIKAVETARSKFMPFSKEAMEAR